MWWMWMALAHAWGPRPQIVTVAVVDEQGEPIPNAWVRVHQTEGRRSVDPDSGLWEASTLYRYDGSPLVFVKGMAVEFTVSAPGFRAVRLQYEVRSRRNYLQVALDVLPQQPILTDGPSSTEALMYEWFQGRPPEED